MDLVGLLGATGQVGELTASALDDRGIPFVAAGRDEIALERLAADVGTAVGAVAADAASPEDVARLAERTALVVNVAGPIGRSGPTVLAAASGAGRPYIDCAVGQRHLRDALHDDGDGGGRPPALLGCGVLTGVGDLLAAVASAELHGARDVHVAYLVSDLRRTATPGLRAAVGDHLGRPTLAWVDGHLREERVGHVRRLVWFPRPVGPRSAVAIPTGEALTVPRHLADVRTVRSYLAVRGPTAELLQGLDALARHPRPRAWLRRRLTGASHGVTPAVRSAQRWACVAEVHGVGDELCRAWAYGHDLAGTTAELLAAVAARVREGRVPTRGPTSLAAAVAPAELLNELADVVDLRWSVREPGAVGAEQLGDRET